jgi:mannosyltransferase OCH1-like enzyme
MIPKIIHQVWIGGGPLTEEAERYHRTWREHHPEWEVILWTKEKVEKELFPLHNQEAYEADTNHGYRADILRLELLHRFGGIYADMDMECLKPHDPLRTLPAFLGRGKLSDYDIGEQYVETSLMGSVPGHPFFERLVRHLSAWAAAFEGYVVSARTGPQWVQRELYAQWKMPQRDQDRPDDPLVLPRHYFYPWWAHEPKGTGVTPETFSAHHWWQSWGNGRWKTPTIVSLAGPEFRGRCLAFVETLPDAERDAFLAVLLETAARDLHSPNVFYQIEGAVCIAEVWGRWPHAGLLERRRTETGLLHAADSGNVFVRDAARRTQERAPY